MKKLFNLTLGGGGKLKSSFKNSLNFTFTDKVLAQDFNCKAHFKREVKKGFTLAEVLITLAIIGVVAAMTIPSVIVNTNQQEFKTGLRKAVSVLNSAITMNKALTGESPYDNKNLFNYLQQHMSVMQRRVNFYDSDGYNNYAFYTTDGMMFEVSAPPNEEPTGYAAGCWYCWKFPLYENKEITASDAPIAPSAYSYDEFKPPKDGGYLRFYGACTQS